MTESVISKCKILVVDDFSAMRHTIKRILERAEYSHIKTCANGKEALKELKYHSYDLIISDLVMPVMGGQELLEKIKEDSKLCHIPFVMITAEGDRELVMAAIAAGVSGFIVKPFTPAMLEEKVHKAIISQSASVVDYMPADHSLPILVNQPSALIEKSTSLPETILVVDDKPDNIYLISNLLREIYTVQAAPSGDKALAIIQQSSPDLILLDIMMPVMDGYEVCQKIKSNLEYSSIPIIFLSAKNQVADVVKGFDLGAVDYVTKPIEPEILKARIRTHLALSHANKVLNEQLDTLVENQRLKNDIERINQHDMKNPLSAISNQISHLMDDPQFSDEQKKSFQDIQHSSHQALNIVSSSLNLFKIEAGTYKPNLVSLNIIILLQQTIQDLNYLSESHFVEVKLKTYSSHSFVMGEESLCYSLLTNVIKNAIEASPEHESVNISLEDHEENLAIRIYNKGVIPESIRQNLFDKYVTADKENGTGLGTYSAKMMALAQHGNLEFEILNETMTMFSVMLLRSDNNSE